MQKKQTILVIASLLVVVLSVTLAYFTAQIIGKGKSVTINSSNLQIIFTDSDGSISGAGIEPGKWNVTKTFTIENKSNETYKYNIVIQDLINTFVTEGYLQYKITSTNGGYSTDGYVDVPKSQTVTDTILGSASIDVGVTQTYTIEFIYKNDENVDQSADMGKTLSGKLFITERIIDIYAGYEEGTLGYQIMGDNLTRRTRSNNNNGTNDFATPFTDATTGTLFTSTESITDITDSPKDVYYYAGNTTNNWVKFGGFYWRIIRTNHDGSIRLLYVETSPDTTSGNIGNIKFNTSDDSPKYVGYKYGADTSLDTIRNNTTDSTIKTFIDTWYENNLTNYTKYLSTCAVYCNDRNITSAYEYSITGGFTYTSYGRLFYNRQPSYNCVDIRDAFSVDNTSAKLDYPIALMTADEIAYAGGAEEKKMSTPYAWFISNSVGTQVSKSWWALTPIEWNGSSSALLAWRSDYLYFTDYFLGDYQLALVRPVTSLKSCVKYSSGDGTAENPYTILETESGC